MEVFMKRIFTVLLIMCLFISLFALTNGITASAAELDEEEIENTDVIEETTENEIIASDDASIVDQEIDVNYIGVPDTTVSLNLTWDDTNDVSHPIRFTRVAAYKVYFDHELLNWIRTEVFDGFTDNNGNIVFSFPNALIGDTCDLAIVVYAQGPDISVHNDNDNLYSYTINDSSLEGLTATDHSKSLNISEVLSEGATDESNLFLQALQISQYAIFASIYYEDMKGSDVENVKIIYPHNIPNKDCFYNSNEKKIYITAPKSSHSGPISPYESCDVIMHEYGHHVSAQEEITDNPGGWHGIYTDMAEHYRNHFSGTATGCSDNCALKRNNPSGYNFGIEDCKKKASALAWGEGYATFFSELAQQYFYDTYISTSSYNQIPPTFADMTYTAHNIRSSSSFNMEIGECAGETFESSITSILYDMYDSYDASEPFDNISLTYQEIWNLLTGIPEADEKTFYGFVNYLKNTPTVTINIPKLGSIIFEYFLPIEITEGYIKSYSTNFTIEYKCVFSGEVKKYRINFYDSMYNLIGSTEFQRLDAKFGMIAETITISDELLNSIIDSGIIFYVTLEIQEGDGDYANFENDAYYITQYESDYSLYSVNDIYDFLGNTCNLHESSSQKQDWYMFRAPSIELFVFEITTSDNICLELFSELVAGDSIENRISVSYPTGDPGKCIISCNLLKNETIYIRIRNLSWSDGSYTTMNYDLTISYQSHNHVYNYSHESIDSNSHKAYCICGDYIIESHTFISVPLGYRCDYCKYFTKFIMVPISSTKPNIDICNENVYNKDENE